VIRQQPLGSQALEVQPLRGYVGLHLGAKSLETWISTQHREGGLDLEELPPRDHRFRALCDRTLEHRNCRVALTVHGERRWMEEHIPVLRAPELADLVPHAGENRPEQFAAAPLLPAL
jgi:hypothetical protein